MLSDEHNRPGRFFVPFQKNISGPKRPRLSSGCLKSVPYCVRRTDSRGRFVVPGEARRDSGMVWQGKPRQGATRHGKIPRGAARRGLASQGFGGAQYGGAWSGMEKSFTAWRGPVWPDAVGQGGARFGTVRHGMEKSFVARHGSARRGMTRWAGSGLAGQGWVWRGKEKYLLVRRVQAWHGKVRRVLARRGKKLRGEAELGMAWSGADRLDPARPGMAR